ncbi:transposase, partial [Vibrio vulnificus]
DAIRFKRGVPLLPPREGASFWENGQPKNLAVSSQKLYGSNNKRKKRNGYHKR